MEARCSRIGCDREEFSVFLNNAQTAPQPPNIYTYYSNACVFPFLSGFAYILIDHLRRTVLVGTELATAQVDTIRLKLFKIGAVVKTSVRRLVLHLSSAYPLQTLFKLVCEKLGGLTALHIDQQTTG